MRGMLLVLLVTGLAGIVFGVLEIYHGSTGPRGAPFTHETYGGPGPIIGGIFLVALALYGLTAGRRHTV